MKESQNFLIFRKATKKDLEFLYTLRNDPIVRQAPFNTEKIDLKTHIQWFEEKIKSPHVLFLIIEYKNQKIGQTRFDRNPDDNSAEINISITESFRSKGLGSKILTMTSKKALEFFQIEIIKAYVKIGNKISINAFKKAGFKSKDFSSMKNQDCIELWFIDKTINSQ